MNAYRRVDPSNQASGDNEASISVVTIGLLAEVVNRQFPRIHCTNEVHIDDIEFGLDWCGVRVYSCQPLSSRLSFMDSIPSSGQRSSPEARLMPAFAITISQLLCGEFLIANSNIATWSSQEVMLHLINWAFLWIQLWLVHDP